MGLSGQCHFVYLFQHEQATKGDKTCNFVQSYPVVAGSCGGHRVVDEGIFFVVHHRGEKGIPVLLRASEEQQMRGRAVLAGQGCPTSRYSIFVSFLKLNLNMLPSKNC